MMQLFIPFFLIERRLTRDYGFSRTDTYFCRQYRWICEPFAFKVAFEHNAEIHLYGAEWCTFRECSENAPYEQT